MDENMLKLIQKYVDHAELAATLQERIGFLQTLCHRAEEDYAERKKVCQRQDADLMDVKVNVCDILDIFGFCHSTQALDILIGLEKEKLSNLDTDDDE